MMFRYGRIPNNCVENVDGELYDKRTNRPIVENNFKFDLANNLNKPEYKWILD